MQRISPEYSVLYTWEFKDDQEDAEIKITLPPTFNQKALKATMTNEKDAVIIAIDNETPIVMGKFFGKVTGMIRSVAKNSVTFTFTKAEEKAWPFLINDAHPETNELDPQSTFILFQIMASSQNPETISQSFELLGKSCNMGFIPALRCAYDLQARNPETAAEASELLQIAALHYKDPISIFRMAMILCENPETRVRACELFLAAGDNGLLIGRSYAGRLFSPLSDIDFVEKDAAKAIELFESVLASENPNEHDPIMCHELAMLYYNGVGVEKDEEKARVLQEKAAKALPEIEPLTIKTVTQSSKKSWTDYLAIGAGIAALAAGAFTAYKVISKRK